MSARYLTALALAVLMVAGAAQPATERSVKQPLTPAAAVETTRLIPEPISANDENPDGAVSISPNGKRFLIRTVRGDVTRNGIWMELMLGSCDSNGVKLDSEPIARLFGTGLGSTGSPVGPAGLVQGEINPLRWIDDSHVAFMWPDDAGIHQVVRLDLASGQFAYVTRHPTTVRAFDVGRNGIVFYTAMAAQPVMEERRSDVDGTVLGANVDAFRLFRYGLQGDVAAERFLSTEWFIQRPDGKPALEITVAGRKASIDYRHAISISPNDRLAIVNANPMSIPSNWDRYTNPNARNWLKESRRKRKVFSLERTIHQLYVVDLQSGVSRPLWDAMTLIYLTKVAWSPDSRFVFLAPTFLPPGDTDASGLMGEAAAIVDVQTGAYQRLSAPQDWLAGTALRSLRAASWPSDHEIEFIKRDEGAQLRRFRKSGHWVALDEKRTAGPVPPFRFEVHQSLAEPPKIFVSYAGERQPQLLFDPNPGLAAKFDLGRVEHIDGALSDGAAWDGLLFYPPDYQAGRRYPLVIQSTYAGKMNRKFTLYGAQGNDGLGPTLRASYPGRILATRGMFVLQLNVAMGDEFGTPDEARLRARAFEAAAEKLSESGLVERDKVGLLGFSRNGYYVEYALSHTNFPFAAAIAADNIDPSYFQHTLMGYRAGITDIIGAPAFGEGLQYWLKNSPGFNADKISAPLRMVDQSSGKFGVFAGWEIYSRLKYLGKPVEFYVMPDAEQHGDHNTQNPRQILAVQQGSIDWFDFWLNGHQGDDPRKVLQYERWQELRRLQEQSSKANREAAKLSGGS